MPAKFNLRGSLPYFLILIGIVAADQLTKLWIRTNFYVGESRPVVGIFNLTYIHNTGASFGIFQNGAIFFTVFSAISFVLMLVMVLFLRTYYKPLGTPVGILAMGLISGGTLGNLIDRFNLGYVVDFLDFRYWPSFNIADSAIVIGSILLVYTLFVGFKTQEACDEGRSQS